MATSVTERSTQRLSEVARHLVVPTGIVTTAWPRVVAQCEEMGITFDSWQHGIGSAALGKRKDGKYAATVGGVVLSIPRQVGKTFLVGAMLVALCILFPGLTVVWSAHRLRTSTQTFQKLKGLTSRKKIKPHMLEPRNANGEQEIRFRNGSVIMFGAREQGFGRGFDEVDVEVFDEAQILTEKALEDMVPAANQSRHPAGALLFFMGTPPRPTDPGEEFTNRRDKALSGKSEDMLFVELSADDDADPDDREQWAKANPSFPEHTPVESMLRMREQLTDEDSFLREGLGVWVAQGADAVIDALSWSLVADPASMAIESLALGVDVSPDRSVASVALAGQRADGLWHVELDEERKGTGWLVPWIVARCERNRIRAVVVDGRSPAASMVEELEKAKIKVTVTSAADMATACGRFYDAAMGTPEVVDGTGDVRFVAEQRLRHTDQPQVNVALSVARKRPLGDAWGWNRKTSSSDITPLVAVTLALWGAQSKKVRRPRARSSESRRAVVV